MTTSEKPTAALRKDRLLGVVVIALLVIAALSFIATRPKPSGPAVQRTLASDEPPHHVLRPRLPPIEPRPEEPPPPPRPFEPDEPLVWEESLDEPPPPDPRQVAFDEARLAGFDSLTPSRSAQPQPTSAAGNRRGRQLPALDELEQLLDESSQALEEALAGTGILDVPTPHAPTPRQVRDTTGLRRSSSAPLSFDTRSLPGPLLLNKGDVIPAILDVAINSDLEGPLRATVARDLHGPTGMLLLPRGSTLLGEYDGAIKVSQSRLLVSWHSLRLPNGAALDLPYLPGLGHAGRAGLSGEVNRHTFSIFRDAALLSLISAGFQLSASSDSRTNGVLSDREIAAQSLGRDLEQVAAEIIRARGLNRQPTIKIPAGTRLNVYVSQPIQFSAPYAH